jgi:hypothetical protein
MELDSAMELFEISNIRSMNLHMLKKKYYKISLHLHPDKNGNTPLSTANFQKINGAYELLKTAIADKEPIEEYDDEDVDACQNKGFSFIVNSLIEGILQSNYSPLYFKLIENIRNGCKSITIKLFEGLDNETTIDAYILLYKYKKVLHINDETLEIIKNIVFEKCKGSEVFILNPSIDDLFENNLYKLDVNNNIYIVPLWHNELYFDGVDGEIIVKCNPELPDNIYIDANNNIVVNICIELTNALLTSPDFLFTIGKKQFAIPTDKITIQRNQTIILKEKGISKIQYGDSMITNMYNVNNKADIFVNLTLS